MSSENSFKRYPITGKISLNSFMYRPPMSVPMFPVIPQSTNADDKLWLGWWWGYLTQWPGWQVYWWRLLLMLMMCWCWWWWLWCSNKCANTHPHSFSSNPLSNAACTALQVLGGDDLVALGNGSTRMLELKIDGKHPFGAYYQHLWAHRNLPHLTFVNLHHWLSVTIALVRHEFHRATRPSTFVHACHKGLKKVHA